MKIQMNAIMGGIARLIPSLVALFKKPDSCPQQADSPVDDAKIIERYKRYVDHVEYMASLPKERRKRIYRRMLDIVRAEKRRRKKLES